MKKGRLLFLLILCFFLFGCKTTESRFSSDLTSYETSTKPGSDIVQQSAFMTIPEDDVEISELVEVSEYQYLEEEQFQTADIQPTEESIENDFIDPFISDGEGNSANKQDYVSEMIPSNGNENRVINPEVKQIDTYQESDESPIDVENDLSGLEQEVFSIYKGLIATDTGSTDFVTSEYLENEIDFEGKTKDALVQETPTDNMQCVLFPEKNESVVVANDTSDSGNEVFAVAEKNDKLVLNDNVLRMVLLTAIIVSGVLPVLFIIINFSREIDNYIPPRQAKTFLQKETINTTDSTGFVSELPPRRENLDELNPLYGKEIKPRAISAKKLSDEEHDSSKTLYDHEFKYVFTEVVFESPKYDFSFEDSEFSDFEFGLTVFEDSLIDTPIPDVELNDREFENNSSAQYHFSVPEFTDDLSIDFIFEEISFIDIKLEDVDFSRNYDFVFQFEKENMQRKKE